MSGSLLVFYGAWFGQRAGLKSATIVPARPVEITYVTEYRSGVLWRMCGRTHNPGAP